jgi:hypothetical protein
MVHHGVLALLESLQEVVPFLELLEGLLVNRAFFLEKAAQFLNFSFGTVGEKDCRKPLKFQ